MTGFSGLAAYRRGQHVDAGLGRADRVQALFGVPSGAARVEHANDDLRDVEALLGDLSDHKVGVVAVGPGDESVGMLDARLDERVDLQRGADGEHSARVLPVGLESDVEQTVRFSALVEHA